MQKERQRQSHPGGPQKRRQFLQMQSIGIEPLGAEKYLEISQEMSDHKKGQKKAGHGHHNLFTYGGLQHFYHYTLTLETRQSLGYNGVMNFLKKTVLVVTLLAVAIGLPLNWLAKHPGTREFRDLRFGEAKVPRLIASWNLKGSDKHLTLNAPKVLWPAFHADGVLVTFKPGPDTVYIAQLGSEKKWLTDIRSNFTWANNALDFTGIHGSFAGQEILGTAHVVLDKKMEYRLSLAVGSLPAQAVIETFKWDKKVAVQGVFAGRFEAEGADKTLSRFDGSFDASSEGGTITILDQDMLKRVADSAHQPFEIVRASFENYHYNSGRARFFMERSDLRLDLALDGEAGKRRLEVDLHDLFPQS